MESKWLEDISKSDTPMFGSSQGPKFDLEGPSLSMECLNADGDEVGCEGVFRDVLVLRVKAEDEVGVDRVEVFPRGAQMVLKRGNVAGVGEYTIQVEDGYHGTIDVMVRAWDRLENMSEQIHSFAFDRRSVELGVLLPEYRTNQTDGFGVPVFASKNVARLTIRGERVARDMLEIEEYSVEMEPSREFTLPLRMPQMDGTYRFNIEAQDPLGNIGVGTTQVVVDRSPVHIHTGPVTVRDRTTHTTHDVAFGEPATFHLYDVDLDPHGWREQSPGWPVVRAWPTKESPSWRPDERDPVRGWYRFSLFNKGVYREGSWIEIEELSPDEPSFSVPINYVSMLTSLHGVQKSLLRPEENLVYHAENDAIHVLNLKVVDAYGNYDHQQWRFRLSLIAAPIFVEIKNQGVLEGQSWRSHFGDIIANKPHGDLCIDMDWFSGNHLAPDTRAFATSMLPTNEAVVIDMDDVASTYRIRCGTFHHGWDASEVGNLSNFSLDLSGKEIRRGRTHTRLATVGMSAFGGRTDPEEILDPRYGGPLSLRHKFWEPDRDVDTFLLRKLALSRTDERRLTQEECLWRWKIQARRPDNPLRTPKIYPETARGVDGEVLDLRATFWPLGETLLGSDTT